MDLISTPYIHTTLADLMKPKEESKVFFNIDNTVKKGNTALYVKEKIDEYENMLHLYNEQEKTKTQINKQIEQTKNWSGKEGKIVSREYATWEIKKD